MKVSDSSQPVIGLAGGIGSGKSLVAKMLQEMGCRVVNADAIGHELLGRPEVAAALTERFGEEIMGVDGAIDRAALGSRAFVDIESLGRLNEVVHPLLREELARQIVSARADATFDGPVVLDAALLLDTDWHELCDCVLFVDAPLAQRRKRVGETRGWSGEELSRRENLQKPLDFKRTRSDHVVGNNSSVSNLRQQVCLFLQQLVARLEDRSS